MSQALPQIFFVIYVCVSTFPTFFASRQSSLYSIGVRCSSCPLIVTVPAAKSRRISPLVNTEAGAAALSTASFSLRKVTRSRASSSSTEKGFVR